MLAGALIPATITRMVTATATFAFDKKSARSFDADGRMRVRDCIISVAEVNPYYGKEIPRRDALGLDANTVYDLYRDPAELERAVDSFNGLPLMIRHVAQTADDPRKDYIGGSVFNARFADGKLRADLLVMDKQAIEYIESGELADLSSSYRYTPDMTAGQIDGRAYHGVMRNIEGNHVALVEDGRATGAHVADSALSSQPGATTVSDTDTREDKILHMLEAIDNRLAAVEGRANDEAKAKAEEDEKRANDEAEAEKKAAEDEAAEKAKEDEKEGEERAMDSKIKSAVDAAVAATNKARDELERAKASTRSVLGDVIAMDSAPAIYRAALEQVGMDVSGIGAGAEGIAWNAYQAARGIAGPVHAMDRASDKSSDWTPNLSNIRVRG